MELHSYAKRKASKKWTIEHKRKLVETRIAYDNIFSKKPLNCLITWMRIISLAKLDAFSVSFVRKQWSYMISKYKQYKRSRLGNVAANLINDELLHKVSQEWEFFYPIHRFMSRKITNLHSYALQEGQKIKQPASNTLTQQQQQKQEENNASLASQLEKMLANNNDSSQEIGPAQNLSMFSSDTNEDYAAAETISSETVSGLDQQQTESEGVVMSGIETSEVNNLNADLINSLQKQQSQNTDHDFYSRKSPKQKDYESDTDEDDKSTQVQPSMEIVTTDVKAESKPADIDSKNVEVTVKDDAAGVNSHDVELIKTQKIPNNDHIPSVSFKPISPRIVSKDVSCGFGASSSGAMPANVGADHGIAAAAASTSPLRPRRSSLSERDKYYRHKRRYNRRLERRFDGLLNVFGQIVKAEYTGIDLRPLIINRGRTMPNGLRFPDHNRFNGNQNGESTTYSRNSSSEDGEMSSSSYSSNYQYEHAEF